MPESLYALYNLALCNLAFFIAYRYVKSYMKARIDGYLTNHYNRKAYYFLFIIFVMYSLFTFFGGDRSGYEEMVADSGTSGFFMFINMEDVYVWIAMMVRGNFLLWKLIVYGGALFLMHLTLRRLHIDNIITLLFFSGLCLVSYGSTRALLAFAIYVYGLSFLHDNNRFKIILGFALIISTYFFHNSMIPIILMTPFVYVKLNKNKVILLLLLFPVFQIIFNLFIYEFFDRLGELADVYDQEHLQQKSDVYIEGSQSTGNNKLPLSYVVNNVIVLVIAIVTILTTLKLNFKKLIPIRLTPYLSIAFYLFYFVWFIRFSPFFNSEFISYKLFY